MKKKNIAIYPIIRNNESIYELACAEFSLYTGSTSESHPYSGNIVIYNILSNKKTNKIINAHQDGIDNIKHYYSSLSKKHFLLSSGQKYTKLWNITLSKTFTKELEIEHDGPINFCNSCLLFQNDDYFILEGYSIYEPKIFNKGGKLVKSINDSGLREIYYIEATYINDEPYVLLSGNYHAYSYNYNNEKIIKYISKENEKEKQTCNIINLFNKDKKLYLLSGYDKGLISIFDFYEAKEIRSLKIGNSNINGLCSFNEKYFLFGDNKEITVINFENEKKIKKFNTSGFKVLSDDCINGIEKIKIYDKGEFIISYSQNQFIIWKLSN